jgi:hypothetical protein
MSEIFEFLFGSQIFGGVVGGSLVVSALYLAKNFGVQLWQFFVWRLTTELVIFSEDPAFDIVNDWLATPGSPGRRIATRSAVLLFRVCSFTR